MNKERNARCKKCGKKMKDCEGHVPKWAFWLGGVMLLLIMLSVIFYVHHLWHTQERREIKTQGNKLFADYLALHSAPDKWWVYSYSPQEPKMETVNKLRAQRDLLEGFLRDYKNSRPPLSSEIAEKFSKIFVSIFYQGISHSIGLASEKFLSENSGFEVCFIPWKQLEKFSFPSKLYYRDDWNAVMIAALEWPRPIFAGLVFHELGHALRFGQEAPGAKAPQNSDEWVAEETTMHDLESSVINASTNEKFFSFIDAFLAKAGGENFAEVISLLSADNLRQLDEICEARNCGQEAADIILGQYLFSFGSRLIDKTLPEKNRLAEKIRLYRFLRTWPETLVSGFFIFF